MPAIGCILIFFGLIVVVLGIFLRKKRKIGWVGAHSRVRRSDREAFTGRSAGARSGSGFRFRRKLNT